MQTPTSRGCRFQISLFSDGFQTSVEVAPRTQHDNIWDADTELEAITGHAGSGCHDMSRHVTTSSSNVQGWFLSVLATPTDTQLIRTWLR